MQGWQASPRDLHRSCTRFGRLLREHGVRVSPDRVARWLRALELLGCYHPADLYWSGRVTLIGDQAHLAVYDDLFRRFWLTLEHAAVDPKGATETENLSRPSPEQKQGDAGAMDAEEDGTSDPEDSHSGRSGGKDGPQQGWRIGQPFLPPGTETEESADAPLSSGLYSSTELLREKDFAAYSRKDQAALLRCLSANPDLWRPRLKARRMEPARRGREVDLRRTLAAVVRSGGDPLRLSWRRRRLRSRKWIFLCDISASMAPYTEALLLFVQAVAARRGNTEVFLFGTRLTRVTPQLRRNRTDRMQAFLQAVRDWHGGTRLGAALKIFNRQYGRRGMAHGAVVFVLSDGLDQGAPGDVAAAMSQLSHTARRVAWVNPLKRSAQYQPLAMAMAEALPYIDDFVSGHNLSTLVGLLTRQVEED